MCRIRFQNICPLRECVELVLIAHKCSQLYWSVGLFVSRIPLESRIINSLYFVIQNLGLETWISTLVLHGIDRTVYLNIDHLSSLQEIVNSDVFCGHLTDEEQQKLLKYLPTMDSSTLSDRLVPPLMIYVHY